MDRKRYLPGVPCWIDTAPPDPDAAVRFYGAQFGWEFEERLPGYRVARLGGRDVAAVAGGGTAPGWRTYVAVESADVAAARVHGAGGRTLVAPRDVDGAGRAAVFTDPEGAVFGVWEAREHHGAELVNAAGSWNWSDLATSDPDGATAFYGAVFGWRADEAGFGVMWRLPGYGDFLAERDPDLRRRHAEPGVPEGFSDAIGWLLPLDGSGAPAWNVTFAVADADAAAARAEELGGGVATAPFDAGPARVAALTDPQGGAFSVSRYAS